MNLKIQMLAKKEPEETTDCKTACQQLQFNRKDSEAHNNVNNISEHTLSDPSNSN